MIPPDDFYLWVGHNFLWLGAIGAICGLIVLGIAIDQLLQWYDKKTKGKT